MSVRRPAITRKKLKNRRFRKTEEAFMRLLFSSENMPTVRTVTDRAGVTRSTFYRHHQSIRLVLPDYRKYIIVEYSHSMRRLLKDKKARITELCRQTLIFMLQNKRFFQVLVQNGDIEVFKQMSLIVQPKIVAVLHLPRNSAKIYLVLAGEVTALLTDWCASGLRWENMPELQKKMTKLADTARFRLGSVT